VSNSTPEADFFKDYANRLGKTLENADWVAISLLARDLMDCWQDGKQLFICGNGGSAGNAIHLANDFLYGIAKQTGEGMRVNALSSNPSVLTCLANDCGYENIYSEQLAVLANPGDVLIVLSGSGNSSNIVSVLEKAKSMEVKSYAILGYSGGKSKEVADVAIHFEVEDMQISEDLQVIIGHMLMQWLYIQHKM